MSARWWTLAVWALAAASALFWGLRIFVKPPQAPAHTRLAQADSNLRGDYTRLLGTDAAAPVAAAPEAPAADARFQLVGVLSPRQPQAAREGLALIAVDGKPARAYRIGAVVDGATVLRSVNARGATLGARDGTSQVALSLAPPAAAATGVLGNAAPMPGAGGAPAPMPMSLPNAGALPMMPPPQQPQPPPQPQPQPVVQPQSVPPQAPQPLPQMPLPPNANPAQFDPTQMR